VSRRGRAAHDVPAHGSASAYAHRALTESERDAPLGEVAVAHWCERLEAVLAPERHAGLVLGLLVLLVVTVIRVDGICVRESAVCAQSTRGRGGGNAQATVSLKRSALVDCGSAGSACRAQETVQAMKKVLTRSPNLSLSLLMYLLISMELRASEVGASGRVRVSGPCKGRAGSVEGRTG